jgi:PAS domain-containing protein
VELSTGIFVSFAVVCSTEGSLLSQPIGAPTDRTLPQLPSDPRAVYAIYVTDLDGCVLSWNAGASRLKGYSPEEIVGLSFSRFFTPEDRADGMPQRAMATAAKEGRFEVEGWRIRKDGSRFWT